MQLLLGDAACDAFQNYGGSIRFALRQEYAKEKLDAALNAFSVAQVLIATFQPFALTSIALNPYLPS